eukprot:3736509-Ditylum_brightwellii.AAC.1
MPPLLTPIIADNDIGEVVQNAVEDQHWIGWDNFMKGWISIKWKAAKKMYMGALPASAKSKEFNKNLWSSKVVTEIWSIFQQIWNAQNAHLHTEMVDTYSTLLNKQVRKTFALQHSMSDTDQLLFHMPLQDQLQCHHDAKAMWLESVNIAVHDFTVTHGGSLSQPTIISFFQHVSQVIQPQTTDIIEQVTNNTEDDTDLMVPLI